MTIAILALTLAVLGAGTNGPLVRTAVCATGELTRNVRLSATVLPWEEATLVAHVTGYVQEVLVREGDQVRRGDPLATIDVPLMSQELAGKEAALRVATARVAERAAEAEAKRSAVSVRRAALARARAELGLKAIRLERVLRLAAEKAATEEQVDEARGLVAIAEEERAEQQASIVAAEAKVAAAEAALESARALAEVARADLDRLRELANYATIRCPFEQGIVYRRFVDAGALVQANATPVLHVMDVERVRVRMDLDERDAPLVEAGCRVVLVPDALSLAPREAEVSRVSRALDPSTRTMLVEIDLSNAERELYAGMFLHADVEVFRRHGALLVPAEALRMREGASYVYVVEEGVLRRRAVRLGADDGITCEIVTGLEPGAEVVLSGAASLTEGMRVRTRAGAGS